MRDQNIRHEAERFSADDLDFDREMRRADAFLYLIIAVCVLAFMAVALAALHSPGVK